MAQNKPSENTEETCAADYYNYGVKLSAQTKAEIEYRKLTGIDMLSVYNYCKK